MIEINIPFIKVLSSPVAYGLEDISGFITGEIQSTFHKYNRNKNSEKFCGFYLPPFQRDEVWTENQKIRLIESIFCEIPINPIIVVNNFDAPDVHGWLIDGQQRMTAIRDFVNGEFNVFNGELGYENMKDAVLTRPFKGLVNSPVNASKVWSKSVITINQIQTCDLAVLKELYERMNFGGTAHTEEDRERLKM